MNSLITVTHAFSIDEELDLLIKGSADQYRSLVMANIIEFPKFPVVREVSEMYEYRIDDTHILLNKLITISESTLNSNLKEKLLRKLINCKNIMISLLDKNIKFPTISNFEVEIQTKNRAGIGFNQISKELDSLRAVYNKIKHREINPNKVFGKVIETDVALIALENMISASELQVRDGIALNQINLSNYESLLNDLNTTGKDLYYVSDEQIWRDEIYGKLDKKAEEKELNSTRDKDLKSNSFAIGILEGVAKPVTRSFFVDNREIGVIQDCRSYSTPELMYSYLESKSVFGVKGQRIRSNQFSNETTKKVINAQQVNGATWQHVEVTKGADFTHYKFTLDLAGPAKVLNQTNDIYIAVETQLINDPTSRNNAFIAATEGLSDEERELLGEFASVLNTNEKDHIIANYAERLLMSEWNVDGDLSEAYGKRIVTLIAELTARGWVGSSESYTRRKKVNGDEILLKFKHRLNTSGKVVGLEYELERNGKAFFAGLDTGNLSVNDLIEQLSGIIEPFKKLDISVEQRIGFIKNHLGDDLSNLSLHEILLKKSDYEFNNKLLIAATGIPNYPLSESTNYQVMVELSWLFGIEKKWNNPLDVNHLITSQLRGSTEQIDRKDGYPRVTIYDKDNLDKNRGFDLSESTLLDKVKLWTLTSDKGFLYAINSELPIKINFGDIASLNKKAIITELEQLPNIEFLDGPKMLIESHVGQPTVLKKALIEAVLAYNLTYVEIPNVESKFLSARYGNDTDLIDISTGFTGKSGLSNIPVIRSRDLLGKLVAYPFDWKFAKSYSHLDHPAYGECLRHGIKTKSSFAPMLQSSDSFDRDSKKNAIIEDLMRSGFGTTVYSARTQKWYVISREIYDTGSFRWQSFDSTVREHKTFNALSDVIDDLIEIGATRLCPRDTFDKNILKGLIETQVVQSKVQNDHDLNEWTSEEQTLAAEFATLVGESIGKEKVDVAKFHLDVARGLISKDPYAIEHISNGLNPSLIKLFERYTGITLPKKQVDIWHKILEWGGVSKESDILLKAKKDLYREEIRLEKLISNALQVKSYFKDLVADGYSEIIVRDRKRYLYNPITERGIDLSRKGRGLTKVQAYLKCLLAVNEAELAQKNAGDASSKNTGAMRFANAQEIDIFKVDIEEGTVVAITDDIAHFNSLLLDDVRDLFADDDTFFNVPPKESGLDVRFYSIVDETKNEFRCFCASVFYDGKLVDFIKDIEDLKEDFVDVISKSLEMHTDISNDSLFNRIIQYKHKEVQLDLQLKGKNMFDSTSKIQNLIDQVSGLAGNQLNHSYIKSFAVAFYEKDLKTLVPMLTASSPITCEIFSKLSGLGEVPLDSNDLNNYLLPWTGQALVHNYSLSVLEAQIDKHKATLLRLQNGAGRLATLNGLLEKYPLLVEDGKKAYLRDPTRNIEIQLTGQFADYSKFRDYIAATSQLKMMQFPTRMQIEQEQNLYSQVAPVLPLGFEDYRAKAAKFINDNYHSIPLDADQIEFLKDCANSGDAPIVGAMNLAEQFKFRFNDYGFVNSAIKTLMTSHEYLALDDKLKFIYDGLDKETDSFRYLVKTEFHCHDILVDKSSLDVQRVKSYQKGSMLDSGSNLRLFISDILNLPPDTLATARLANLSAQFNGNERLKFSKECVVDSLIAAQPVYETIEDARAYVQSRLSEASANEVSLDSLDVDAIIRARVFWRNHPSMAASVVDKQFIRVPAGHLLQNANRPLMGMDTFRTNVQFPASQYYSLVDLKSPNAIAILEKNETLGARILLTDPLLQNPERVNSLNDYFSLKGLIPCHNDTEYSLLHAGQSRRAEFFLESSDNDLRLRICSPEGTETFIGDITSIQSALHESKLWNDYLSDCGITRDQSSAMAEHFKDSPIKVLANRQLLSGNILVECEENIYLVREDALISDPLVNEQLAKARNLIQDPKVADSIREFDTDSLLWLPNVVENSSSSSLSMEV